MLYEIRDTGVLWVWVNLLVPICAERSRRLRNQGDFF